MEKEVFYHLTFDTPLHLGRPNRLTSAQGDRSDDEPIQASRLGLEKTDTYIRADTLFSAICQMWKMYYDTDSLEAFLKSYIEDKSELPLMLTSAFPYAHDICFYPKPISLSESKDTHEDIKSEARKQIKKLQFVSSSVFQHIISGYSPQFSKNETDDCESRTTNIVLNGEKICLINGESVWVNCEESEQLKKAFDFKDKKGSKKVEIWETLIRPRVTIDRQSAGSEIWHIQTVSFNKKCGLWFAAKFDTVETQNKFETLLRVLGDTGIGGERNAGYGMFRFTNNKPIPFPSTKVTDRFVTLSPICPDSSEQLAHLLIGDFDYSLITLSGWATTIGNAARRNQVNMFAEGSVFPVCEDRVGKLIDLKSPKNAHPVYRYGYAWQVGIKGAEQ